VAKALSILRLQGVIVKQKRYWPFMMRKAEELRPGSEICRDKRMSLSDCSTTESDMDDKLVKKKVAQQRQIRNMMDLQS
jgi:hypothetical protein